MTTNDDTSDTGQPTRMAALRFAQSARMAYQDGHDDNTQMNALLSLAFSQVSIARSLDEIARTLKESDL